MPHVWRLESVLLPTRAWRLEGGPRSADGELIRSADELMEAAAHYERVAAMNSSPALKPELAVVSRICVAAKQKPCWKPCRIPKRAGNGRPSLPAFRRLVPQLGASHDQS